MRILIVGRSPFQNDKTLYASDEFRATEFIYSENPNKAYDLWEACAPDVVAIYLESDGAEACSLIRKIRQNPNCDYTLISLFSSKRNSKARIDCLAAGADNYLTLPIRHEELILWIQTAKRLISVTQRSTLVYSLSQLLAMRDSDSGSQFYQVSNYCRILAEELRRMGKYADIINDRFLDDLALFSSIHDIGKIGMDDTILKKPGRYTQSEKDLMKKHTIIGAEFVENLTKHYPGMRSIKSAIEIIRWHHERYDGSGYPDGLQGTEIPLHARIVAVADVYDALVNERVYKKAYSHAEAMHILLIDERKFYDPDVLTALINAENLMKNVKGPSIDKGSDWLTKSFNPIIDPIPVLEGFGHVPNKFNYLWSFHNPKQ